MINKLQSLYGIGFAMLCLFVLTPDAHGQGYTSPTSWHEVVFDTRISALGQSTAALNNSSAYQVNPAVPMENGVLRGSGFLFSTQPFTNQFTSNGPNLYNAAVGYSSGRFTYSAIVDRTVFDVPGGFSQDSIPVRSTFIRLQTGYRLSDRFSVGAGFVHASYSAQFSNINVPSVIELEDESGTAWGLSFGAYYQDSVDTEHISFTPMAGLSLNDLSTGFEIAQDENNGQLPGKIRLAVGLEASSAATQYGLPLAGLGLYAGLNKHLARSEVDRETGEVSFPSGFEALFTSWNSIDRFDGLNFETITLGEQISSSFGVEANVLNTLFLRYGVHGGADFWVRPQRGLGVEIDLYYISIAYTNISYRSSDQWLPQDDVSNFQATIRVPIDGRPRNTLIGNLLGTGW